MDGHGHVAAPGQSNDRSYRHLGSMGGHHSSGAHPVVKISILRRKRRGAALMLALWALFLLSAMVISWALDIDSRLALSGSSNRILEAEAMACSGAEVALHPSVKPGSPNLTRKVNAHQSYNTTVTGEGGRLNLNWIVAGEDPARLEILRKYFENKGIDLNE